MEVINDMNGVNGLSRIDYEGLVETYNGLEVGAAVKLDPVYNITTFKQALVRRGVRNGVDFQAFNRHGSTYVKRVTTVPMKQV